MVQRVMDVKQLQKAIIPRGNAPTQLVNVPTNYPEPAQNYESAKSTRQAFFQHI